MNNLTWHLRQHMNARRILILPLSWRNPAVVAFATVKAILLQNWHDVDIRKSCLRDGSALPPWMPDACTYVLADLRDVWPFTDVIEDNDDLLRPWTTYWENEGGYRRCTHEERRPSASESGARGGLP